MTFWETPAAFEITTEREQFDELISNPDTPLSSVVNSSFCLQELRNGNEKLFSLLKQTDVYCQLLMSVLNPPATEIEEQVFNNDKYRFVHHCCDALCLGAEVFAIEFSKYPELVSDLVNFLIIRKGPSLNSLSASYYSRLVINFLSKNAHILDLLESSPFLDNCLSNLQFSSIFELVCSIATFSPHPEVRARVKTWYLSKQFVYRLLDYFTVEMANSMPFQMDNAAALWAEFVRSLRDYQYSFERCEDPLLDFIQSEDVILKLLEKMFPTNEGVQYSPLIIANGTLVLNALLETNLTKNAPSTLLNQEAEQGGTLFGSTVPVFYPSYSAANASDDEPSNTSGADIGCWPIDSERVVERLCSERADQVLQCVLYALEEGPDGEMSDMLVGCMQLLVNLVNTNHLPTHQRLYKIFTDSPRTSMARLFDAVHNTPDRSVYNALLVTLVLHILYSTTTTSSTMGSKASSSYDDSTISSSSDQFVGDSFNESALSDDGTRRHEHQQRQHQSPLINYLITELKLPELLILFAGQPTSSSKSTSLLVLNLSLRAFCLQLAARLANAQISSPNASYIEELMNSIPCDLHQSWTEFCERTLQVFVDQNRSDKVLSTTSRSSGDMTAVDELSEILEKC